MTQVDVVIVGAGAAGVGAGLALQAAGQSFVILEAADRVGGRAFTDKVSMALPWDHGCHWMHCADVNPLVAYADRLGATYVRQARDGYYRYWLKGRWLDASELAVYGAAVDDAFDAVYRASRNGMDVPVSEILPDPGPYGGAVRHILQLMASQDPELESASAYGDYEDTETNWPVVSGYGDLIERMASGLPIRTGVTVTAVQESEHGVDVVTSAGSIQARAVIVTVSTSVLASGAIKVTGTDVQPVLDMAAQMPCGSYEKVCVGLRRALPGLEGALFASIEPEGGHPVNVQCLDWSDEMVICHLGGSVARDVGAEGPEGLRAFAMERLVQAFGGDIRDEVSAMTPTGWADNPLIQGAYSAVRPGYAQARRDLIGLHTGRVGFAGEAFALRWQATAHGAYQSGQDVAGRMIREELT